MLDLKAFEQTELRTHPYPYIVVENFILPEALQDVLKDFPEVDHGGSIPIAEVTPGEAFDKLVKEIEGEDFRQAIAKKFNKDLDDYPVMTTVRGQMREKDGRIHTDSKTKVITILVYFNENWTQLGGRLRVLNDGENLENYVEEIIPNAGTLVVFEVTDNCWHGHSPCTGERRSIQTNYVTSEAAKGKHRVMHRLSAKVKKAASKMGLKK